jgi:hypothetical protein
MTASRLSKESADILPPELDLFYVPPTKTGLIEGEWVEKQPHGGIPDGESPIEFVLDGSSDYYTNLRDSKLHVQCKIKKRDGTNLPADVNNITVAPSTLMLHTLFSSITIDINGVEVEHEANYANRAYLETLLNHGTEAKETHLASALWFEDGLKPSHTANLTTDETNLLKKRADVIKGSKTIDLIGRLHCNLSHQPRYLIPGLTIRFVLRRNSSRYILQKLTDDDATDYEIEITKAEFLVRRVKVHPSIYTIHSRLLEQNKDVMIPINRVETQYFTISPQRESEVITVLQNRQNPKRILFCLLSHSAKNGSYLYNPFNFHHYNMSSINLLVNGSNVLAKPLRLNFDGDQYMRAYSCLQTVCGKALHNDSNGITPKMFAEGHCIIGFDLAPDLCQGEGVHVVKHGTTSLEIEFSTPLTETVSVFTYCEFDDMLKIDKSRVVTHSTRVA